MLSVEHLNKRFGSQEVLRDLTFSVDDHEKIGVIGANGCGKSTLLRIIAGVETADSGSVGGDAACGAIGYLTQGEVAPERSIAAECMMSRGELWRLGSALSGDVERGSEETLALLDAFEALGSWPSFREVVDALRGLGVDYLNPETLYSQLSGGERTKLGLADVLLSSAGLLLLDEPTNHLDLGALAWLEGFLAKYQGAVLLVSHDRALLDVAVDAVVEIDAETHRARRFAGGYSAYQAEREHERVNLEDAYRRQLERIERVQRDIQATKQRAQRFDATSANDHWRRIGKKVARTAKVRERRLERSLESEERLEKPKQAWSLKAGIAEATRSGDLVVEARGLCLAFGGRRLLHGCSLLMRQGERVVLTGANGSGKTTLLRLLLGQMVLDAGSVRLGAGVKPGYLSQQQEGLDLTRTPLDEIRAAAAMDETAARTYLHRFLFTGDEVLRRNSALSFGQRARLALARLILEGVNFLVLDEPLNHLDIPSRERFEAALEDFGGTVLAVSHDRHFIRRFATRVLALRDGRLVEE